VNDDATFLIFNSGTYELIGILDRGNQTLYVTRVITTTSSTCDYGMLHTGLFIAAIRDAKKRSLQLRLSLILVPTAGQSAMSSRNPEMSTW
jgi:hypothetical protein